MVVLVIKVNNDNELRPAAGPQKKKIGPKYGWFTAADLCSGPRCSLFCFVLFFVVVWVLFSICCCSLCPFFVALYRLIFGLVLVCFAKKKKGHTKPQLKLSSVLQMYHEHHEIFTNENNEHIRGSMMLIADTQ